MGIVERVEQLEAQVKTMREALERIEALLGEMALALGFSPQAVRDIIKPKAPKAN